MPETDPELYARKAKEIIDKEFIKGVMVKDIAKRIGITPNYLSSIYRWHIGESIKETITRKKLELAKDLLRKTKLKVRQIAKVIGWKSYYFSRVFVKAYGETASNFRNTVT